MTRYLPREKLSPAEAKEVPRAEPEVLPRLPREITFPKVDNGSYTPPRSDLSILYYTPYTAIHEPFKDKANTKTITKTITKSKDTKQQT